MGGGAFLEGIGILCRVLEPEGEGKKYDKMGSLEIETTGEGRSRIGPFARTRCLMRISEGFRRRRRFRAYP
jgi:hypothetical protein